MKSLTIKSGIILTVVLLAFSLYSCTPYANVGVGTGYGYGGGYYGGYRPYGYGYGYRPPVVIAPRPYFAPRPYYSAPRSYSPRSYGGGVRGGYSGRRR